MAVLKNERNLQIFRKKLLKNLVVSHAQRSCPLYVYYCFYNTKGWSNVYGATIDAHTGRVLAYSMGIA